MAELYIKIAKQQRESGLSVILMNLRVITPTAGTNFLENCQYKSGENDFSDVTKNTVKPFALH
ncbi:hypothetical protein HRF87_00565 [Bacillus sp. CRN 9]|nr:hypothetical protein [Bacillus sp. CRN 9]